MCMYLINIKNCIWSILLASCNFQFPVVPFFPTLLHLSAACLKFQGEGCQSFGSIAAKR